MDDLTQYDEMDMKAANDRGFRFGYWCGVISILAVLVVLFLVGLTWPV